MKDSNPAPIRGDRSINGPAPKPTPLHEGYNGKPVVVAVKPPILPAPPPPPAKPKG